MSYKTYRLTALHQRVDEAILTELKQAVPSSFRLLRLKSLKLKIKSSLRASTALQLQAA